MNREKKLAKNTLVLSIGTLLPKITSFITLPVLTGYLTQEQYGNYDLVTVLVSLFLPAVTLQIQTAAFRFLIDARDNEDEKRKIVTNIYIFVMMMSTIALFIFFLMMSEIDAILKIMICCYYFIDIINNSTLQIARGLARNFEYSISSAINSIFQLIFIVAFVAVLKIQIVGAVLSLLLSSLVSFLYLFIKAKIYFYIDLKLVSKKDTIKLLKYSWPMVPNNMSIWIMRVSDRFIILAFLGSGSNAIYAVANKIPNILSLFQSTFTMAWQENASVFCNDDDIDKYYSSMFDFIFSFMAGALGILIAITPVLFRILIRGKYQEAFTQMPILFIGMFFSCMASYLGGIYIAYKATKSVGITTILSAVCNVAIDLIMIKWAGLYAASISTLISYIVLFVYRLLDVRKMVDLKYDVKKMLFVLTVLVVECMLVSQQSIILKMLNFVISITFFIALNHGFIKKILWILERKVRKK